MGEKFSLYLFVVFYRHAMAVYSDRTAVSYLGTHELLIDITISVLWLCLLTTVSDLKSN